MPSDEEEKPDATEDQDTEESSVEASGLAASRGAPFAWMKDSLDWGHRVEPGKHGMTMRAINVGSYADVPEFSTDMSRRPRGASPVPGVPRTDFYALSSKVDIWSDNAVDLYEEAIQRRWMYHEDVPWDQLAAEAPEVDLAMRQLCTELAQQATIETDTIGNWLHKMNYAYHEVKTFLATEIFDSARHYSAFRERALVNGGVLGVESPGHINRRLVEVRAGWTEAAVYLYLIRSPLTLLLYRYGEAYATNPADKYLFRRSLEDKARHMAYGMAHVKYAVEHQDEGFGRGLSNLMQGVEFDLGQELKDPVLWEALAIIFGGGLANISAGMEVVKDLQQRYIEDYLARMAWVGVPRTEANLSPALKEYLRREEATPA